MIFQLLVLFPCNRGKHVCVGLKSIFGCVGGYPTFGNHVGDWECVKVQFRNYRAQSIDLSIHSFGISLAWDGSMFKNSCQSLSMVNGHLMVYAAHGYHGIWPVLGNHAYTFMCVDMLSDSCSAGMTWETWNNLKFVYYKQSGQFTGEFGFMNFKGHWV